MIVDSNQAEKEAVLNVAKLMITAARTAPKAGGIDNITAAIITGEEKNGIADKLEKIGRDKGPDFFIRDSQNLRSADVLVLIGVKTEEEEWKSLKLIDLGIAIGSAVKIASMFNIDNRIMYSVGVAAEEMGIIEGTILGIPLSVKGKNIFFDRK